MANRSRVWPDLLKSSLNFELPTTTITLNNLEENSTNCNRSSSSPPNRLAAANCRCQLKRAANYCLSSACRLSGQLEVGCCGPAASDILCVAGGITAITGALIACFGVFPRNQAGVRLYLEVVGCAMVIVGVLIVFASLRMRPTNQPDRLHPNLLSFDSDRVSSAPIWLTRRQPVRAQREQFPMRPQFTSKLQTDWPPNWSALNQLTIRSSPGGASAGSSLVSANQLETDDQVAHHGIADAQASESPELEPAPSLIASSCFGEPTQAAPSQRDHYLGSQLELVNDWIPPAEEDLYGDVHKAAIETALSMVLTVSTLVGFHSNQMLAVNSAQCCCLHHAVQVSAGGRNFMTGLLIGTLLGCNNNNNHYLTTQARNAAQPGGGGHQSAVAHYPAPHSQSQSPLFIIIPSAKSAKPRIVSPSAELSGYPESLGGHYPSRRFMRRRIALSSQPDSSDQDAQSLRGKRNEKREISMDDNHGRKRQRGKQRGRSKVDKPIRSGAVLGDSLPLKAESRARPFERAKVKLARLNSKLGLTKTTVRGDRSNK